jgi:hypothetical protein
MTYVPPPRTLPAFPNAVQTKPKTRAKSGGLLKRWKDAEFIYEWDTLHGRVEKYDKKGKHLGEFDCETGKQTKEANPIRRIEP